MTKEIETWIEETNPYEVEVFPDPMDPFMYLGGIEDDTKKKMWEEGAKAMAEHLQSQPPTKKQIIGVLQYVYNEILPEIDMTPRSFDILVEDILNKWNNENRNK